MALSAFKEGTMRLHSVARVGILNLPFWSPWPTHSLTQSPTHSPTHPPPFHSSTHPPTGAVVKREENAEATARELGFASAAELVEGMALQVRQRGQRTKHTYGVLTVLQMGGAVKDWSALC